jgi:hypothetical protein
MNPDPLHWLARQYYSPEKKMKNRFADVYSNFFAKLEANFNTWIQLRQPNEYGYFPDPDPQPCSI